MEWQQAWALHRVQARLSALCEHDVKSVMDVLVDDVELVERDGVEHRTVTRPLVDGLATGSDSAGRGDFPAAEQFLLLVGFLLSHTPGPIPVGSGGRRSRTAFEGLCFFLCEIFANGLATEMEELAEFCSQANPAFQAEAMRETEPWRRTCQDAFESRKRRSEQLAAARRAAGGRGENSIAANLRPPHAPRPNQPPDTYRCNDDADDDEDSLLLERYRCHLIERCGEAKRQTALAGITSRRTRVDVKDFFASIQAMSAEEAEHYSGGADGADRNCHTVSTDRGFEIGAPRQLLQTDPMATSSSSSDAALELVKSCILVSPAGSGKTTMCQMLVSEFCEQASASDEFASDGGSPLTRVCRYPVYLSCRTDAQLRLASDDWVRVLGLDHDALRFDGRQRQRVLRRLEARSERVLFVVDGLDEAGSLDLLADASAIRDVLRWPRARFTRACVLLTGRPCRLASSLIGHCDAYYRLAGFTEAQLKAYCQRTLGDELGGRCWDELSAQGVEQVRLAAMATPLLATLACELYRSASFVPHSVTLLYARFIQQVAMMRPVRVDDAGILARALPARPASPEQQASGVCCGSNAEHRGRCSSRSGGNPGVGDSFLDELGSVALHHYRRKEYRFPATALSERCLSAARRAGVVALRDDAAEQGAMAALGERSVTAEFPHVTFQEYFAARCLSLGADPGDEVRRRAAPGDVGVGEETLPFWKFVCGMLPNDQVPGALQLLKAALEVRFGGQRSRRICMLLACFLESYEREQDHRRMAGGSLSAPFTAGHFPGTTGTGLSGVSAPTTTATVAKAHVAQAARCVAGDRLDLATAELNVMDEISLKRLLDALPSLAELDLSGSNARLRNIGALLVEKAATLKLNGTAMHGLPLEFLTDWLCLETSVTSALWLQRCGLQADDAPSLSDCLFASPRLEELRLDGNPLGNEFLSELLCECTALSCSNMRHLFLPVAQLSAGCGRDLADVVDRLPSLEKLSLVGNRLVSADAHCLLTSLQGRRQCCVLLCDNRLDDDVGAALCSFFQYRRTHVSHGNRLVLPIEESGSGSPDGADVPRAVIDVRGNRISERCLSSVAELACMADSDEVQHNLKTVRGRSLVAIDIVELMHAKGGNLAESFIGDDGLCQLVPEISRGGLERLRLKYCQITSVGCERLARGAIVNNQRLQVLDLYQNTIGLAGIIAVLDACRSRASSLRAVSFEDNPLFEACTCDPDATQRLYQSLQRCRSVRRLFLARTRPTDDVAVGILRALTENRSVAFLGLNQNGLGDAVAFALADAKRRNTTLRRVALSDNRVTESGARHLLAAKCVMRPESMDAVWLKNNPCPPELYRLPLTNGKFYATYESILEF